MQVIDMLEQRGLDVKETSDQLVLECPLCQDHKPRLYVHPDDGRWICHNCDERGHLLSLLERVCRMDPVEAYHAAQKLGGIRRKKPEPLKPMTEVPLPDGFTLLADGGDLSSPYYRYLRGRDIPDEVAHERGFGFTLIGEARYRVIIPITEHGHTQAWVARAIRPDQEPKLVNAEQMESSRLLYNIDAVRGQPDVVVVEGPFDALALPDRAVATLGAKMSPLQRIKLATLSKNVTMMWDVDEAGIKATVKVVPELLMTGFNVRLVILGKGDDVSSAGPTRVAMALRNAVPVDSDWSRRKIQKVLEEGKTSGW